MTQLGNGLGLAGRHEDALTVLEAELAILRRLGDSEENLLVTQTNLSGTYVGRGRLEEALRMRRSVYYGCMKLYGEEHARTITVADNFAASLTALRRFEEAKKLLRKTISVARRVLGESNNGTLRVRWSYAIALYSDPNSTLDDLGEAVTTLKDTARTARRVLGGSHPLTTEIEKSLRDARAALRARETPPRNA